MLRLYPGYVFLAIAVLLIEVAIALFVHDAIVRPYAGDSLAVVLVYLGLRGTTRLGPAAAVGVALAVAVAVEVGQLVGVLRMLGLEHQPVARVVMGTGFDPADFIAYAAGAIAVLTGEGVRRQQLIPPPVA